MILRALGATQRIAGLHAGLRDAPLTRDQILRAAEEVLRRYGPAKATVLDVARALGVSHGSVYRHFPSKTALREAVAERWLERAHAPLAAVVTVDAPAPWRLRQWLSVLFATKRAKALDDPELFATYHALVSGSSAVTDAHVATMVGQIESILAGGMASGEFARGDAAALARAVWDATTRFHDPACAPHWSEPGADAAFEAVCALVLSGLSRPAQRRTSTEPSSAPSSSAGSA
jgi:AcrR family transcriptional regulator